MNCFLLLYLIEFWQCFCGWFQMLFALSRFLDISHAFGFVSWERHCYFSHIPIRFLNFENILRPIYQEVDFLCYINLCLPININSSWAHFCANSTRSRFYNKETGWGILKLISHIHNLLLAKNAYIKFGYLFSLLQQMTQIVLLQCRVSRLLLSLHVLMVRQFLRVWFLSTT